jgi:rhodanese-related sulfurtransferase
MDRSELEIRPEQLKARLDAGDSLVLVDVRQPEEFEICHLPGSKLVPLNELAGNLDELDPKDEIIVICHHGVRSLDATFFLRSNGYDSAKSLAGGVDLWSLAIDPTVPRY